MAGNRTNSSNSPKAQKAEILSRLFESVHEGIYVGTITATRTITLAANPHLKLMFGYSTETDPSQVRPFDTDRFTDNQTRESFIERLKRDGAVSDYILRLRRADGNPMWLEITAHVEHSNTRDELIVSALMRDVSERRRLEDQTRDMYHQLMQAEKLAALGQTISGVAHELNNPLATILTWSERLSDRPLDDTSKRGIETILRESERAAKIVRKLLTFARKRHTTRTMVDVNQVVRETMALRTYEQSVTNITVIDGLAAGLPLTFADPYQLQQVLLNLIINAEQAMQSAHGRGTLVLRTWHNIEDEIVVLEINDDGPGVPEDVQLKIFDPFFTTKDVGKGTGLGLTVAYAIAQEHGGQIRVKSSPGKGASFFVELPARKGAPKKDLTRRPSPEAKAASVKDASVLIVEDETALASAMAEGLRDVGFSVDHASDGVQALELVGTHNYVIVFCDLKMPRLDGVNFYRAIAATSPALARRVVFVSGDIVDADTERFLEENGCRLLTKPFRLADLQQVAREALE